VASTDDDGQDETLTALKDLVQTVGWKAFVANAREEYGPSGYGRLIHAGVAAIPNGPDRPYEVARVVEQIDATVRAVNAIIDWPAQEIARRTTHKSKRPFAALRRQG